MAAFAFLAMVVPSARAATVSFYTVGYFGGPASTGSGSTLVNFNYAGNTTSASGPSFAQNSTVVADRTSVGNTTTLVYHNNTEFYQNFAGGLPSIPFSVEVTNGPENANFGYFEVTSGDTADLLGLTFTLEIHQIAPSSSPNTGSLFGSFSGSFTSFGGNVVFRLSPNTISIPNASNGVTYTVEPTDRDITINRFGPSMLDGTVAVPLPGVATAGLSMFGGLGGLSGLVALRRRWLGVA